MCSDRRKSYGCGQKKTEGTSSSIFGIGTAAKYCELKLCADPVHSTEPTTKMNLITWTFCFPKKTTEYSVELFLSIYSYLIFFSQVLNFTSVKVNRFAKHAKLLKNLFFKSDGSDTIYRQKKRRLPKSTMRFPAKKRWWHSPPPAGLSWDSPRPFPESARADVRWRHNQNFSDRKVTKFA